MPIVEWNISFLLGIQEIDQHHKHLVQLLNKAYDDFREGSDIEPSILNELVDYTAYHFSYEERLMTESSYPGLAEHKGEHASFTARISEFQKKHQRRADIAVELLWFLCNWVTHHMRETDLQFGRYVDLNNFQQSIVKQRRES